MTLVFLCGTSKVQKGFFSRSYILNLLHFSSNNRFYGTKEYASPELFSGKFYQEGIDIWALGIILFELTNGYLPYNEENKIKKDIEFRHKDIFKEVKISSNLKQLLKGMLAYQTNDRLTIAKIKIQPWYLMMTEIAHSFNNFPPNITFSSYAKSWRSIDLMK